MNEAESLAAEFHRALAFSHAIALWFNWRRRNWAWCAFHGAAAILDFRAATSHEKEIRNQVTK